ncbi:hypothetical protein J7E52_26155 [Bacillus sp. ISL-34]|uniref:hypothetical protein n=1 Tax=Bacillus sp. ISL-34 TaxID=2819121 RepID=UPI001BE91C6C|nr:hypothetical protein [Bacillus sp. ISL-34]MBT2650134.1 hypothetical protein [Bacillus sp. ISL-34]
MKITSISFKEPPVHHEFPPLYEGLGLPELSAFIQQRFEFVYTLGEVERMGLGSIRFYKRQRDFEVHISDKLPGVGPIKLRNLKGMLLEEAKTAFIENIESEPEKRKVYYGEFRRPRKDAE